MLREEGSLHFNVFLWVANFICGCQSVECLYAQILLVECPVNDTGVAVSGVSDILLHSAKATVAQIVCIRFAEELSLHK